MKWTWARYGTAVSELSSAWVLALLLPGSCSRKTDSETGGAGQHCRQVPETQSNITFVNALHEAANFNYFTYPFIYYGLPDLYLTSNMGLNAPYLNEGGLTFEDITQLAGVAGVFNRWTTGTDRKPAYIMLIVGKRAGALLKTANARLLPATQTLAREHPNTLPLFRDKYKPGESAIYVYQDNACQLPVDNLDEAIGLIARLRVRPEGIAL